MPRHGGGHQTGLSPPAPASDSGAYIHSVTEGTFSLCNSTSYESIVLALHWLNPHKIMSSCIHRRKRLMITAGKQLIGKQILFRIGTYFFMVKFKVDVFYTWEFFFLKYIVTHEQVTRSAPSREPDDHRDLTTRENKLSMSRHSLLRKEGNSK